MSANESSTIVSTISADKPAVGAAFFGAPKIPYRTRFDRASLKNPEGVGA